MRSTVGATALGFAQRVIAAAVQLFGGLGERPYREIRPLRIYKGASKIQKLIIGGQVLGK